MAGNKYKGTQKFKNVHNFIKCTLQQIYNIFQIYPLPSNKTVLRNSQHCTKLQKEIHNLFHNKFYRKTGVLLLLNRQKIKFAFSIE